MEEELSWSHSEQPTELVAIGELIFCCATSYLLKQGTFQALTAVSPGQDERASSPEYGL